MRFARTRHGHVTMADLLEALSECFRGLATSGGNVHSKVVAFQVCEFIYTVVQVCRVRWPEGGVCCCLLLEEMAIAGHSDLDCNLV